jgi:hypothetical protein
MHGAAHYLYEMKPRILPKRRFANRPYQRILTSEASYEARGSFCGLDGCPRCIICLASLDAPRRIPSFSDLAEAQRLALTSDL